MICCIEPGLTRPYIYCIYIKHVTCKTETKKDKRSKKIKLDDGQLLLTVTYKRQTLPLIREGAQQRQGRKIQTELISGSRSQGRLDAKRY
jgi:hypothetical protein